MVHSNHSQINPKRIIAAIMFGGCLLISQSGLAANHSGETKQQAAIINVSGSGSVAIAPDIAIISVGVLRQAKTARGALNANNEAMAKVLAAMKAENIADKDLQTSNFNIQPQYQRFKRTSSGQQKPPQIVGYQVSNQLTLRIRDLAKVGAILDKVVTLGVNSGGNIQFTNDNPQEAITAARIKAMKNAITKATTLTSAANVSLGRITSINEQSFTPRPMALAKGRMAMVVSDESAVPIQGGENSYRVNVNVSWEIAQ